MGNAADPAWIEQLKRGGALPLTGLDSCFNGWCSPPGDCFRVRGPDYFATKAKIAAGDWLLEPLAVDWIKSSSKIYDVLRHPQSRITAALGNLDPIPGNSSSILSNSPTSPFVWAFNLQVPSKENYSAIIYFVSHHRFPENSLIDRFLRGDDAFKNSRLKLIANVVQGPWIVKTAVGEQAICVLGRTLTCKYSTAPNFLEVDVDIGSSMVANAIVHLAIGYITSLTVDLAFLIESQHPDELPERILGAVRLGNLELQSAVPLELMSGDSINNSFPGESSFSSRLWKGFTSLLTPAGQSSTRPDDEDDDDVKDSSS
ncbi:hypothetical protein SELMODRAFT_404285 [Selaginella moellendorffii]|uniref:Protein ENHANCED DISEASE RESISTANCE 2 C-terminal domain-containing protein n=1 Tax=Selaginella moellendorffii TaxID=88036 RepID=D8QUV2_SELML|nr:protein ENHANCED DISEASE RESISTANCE 2-like [Selaginella moellendorffii]EFJ36357.1 hypothetical protein SELMODRAFT_404285 [Selaginella moellendorffii]|eukprot:XP_002962894.1 protein ENHANCED DISEASE RESISTANCE 2-like [Selaginella moellendorffii]